MDIYQSKKNKELTMIIGYFGEVMPCNDCIVKISQNIYLTTIQNIGNYRIIEKRFCYSHALKESVRWNQEIKDNWCQYEGGDKQPAEPLQCSRCGIQQSESVEKFRIYGEGFRCVDCLVLRGKVIQDERKKEEGEKEAWRNKRYHYYDPKNDPKNR